MEPMQTSSTRPPPLAVYPLPDDMPGTPRPPPVDEAGWLDTRASPSADAAMGDVEFAVAAAALAAKRSSDPWGGGGAALVDARGDLIGTGFNTTIGGVPWDMCGRGGPLVVHAAAGALARCTTDLADGMVALTHFPCADCARQIVLRGITRLVFVHNTLDRDAARTAHEVLEAAFVETRRFRAEAPVVLRCAGDA